VTYIHTILILLGRFSFSEKTTLPNNIFFTGFVYTSTTGKLPFQLRDKCPQVTCLSNIPFVRTRLIGYIACMIGQQCMFSFWFGKGRKHLCLSAVDAWKGWPRQGCCYKHYCARSRCEKRLFASSCLSVRPSVRSSVCPHGTTRLPLDGFSWYLIYEYFSKIYRERSRFITIGRG